MSTSSERAAGPKETDAGQPQAVVAEMVRVSKWFGENQVLRDVTLSIRRHEVVVLIGPSGSGKTTLLRTVNGLETVDRGSVTVAGTVVADAQTEAVAGRRRRQCYGD